MKMNYSTLQRKRKEKKSFLCKKRNGENCGALTQQSKALRHDLAISLTVNDKNSRQVSQRDKPNDPAITVKQPRAIHRRRTYMYIYPQKKKPIRQTQSRSSKKIKTFNKTKKRKNAKKKYSSQCWTR